MKKILSSLEISPSDKELMKLKSESKKIKEAIESEVAKAKIRVETCIGGSLAKETILKKELYDIDIYLRFDSRYENIEKITKNILRKVVKKTGLPLNVIHGSRDYFRIKKDNIIFEIIPVTKIKNPREARNVTDLSYFHVNYVKRKLKNKKLAREILIAKEFCKAQGVYGAESYIGGFSGYGLECLIIYYKSFEKMAKKLANVKDKIIIDIEKKYKKKEEVFFSLNENKLNNPIILIDPTWKERNVLAALTKESFLKFQNALKKFVLKPSISFFKPTTIDEKNMRKKAAAEKAKFIHLKIRTNKQAGDIAGTKLKKFSKMLIGEISHYYSIIDTEFHYDLKNSADFYIILKAKPFIIKRGPPVTLKNYALKFKKKNKNVFEKDGVLYSKIKVNDNAKLFLKKFSNVYKYKIKEMSITNMSFI